MKRDVVLSIQGRQRYGEQEPETIELVTGGTMEFRDGGWDITYEESELTGLAGVVTIHGRGVPGGRTEFQNALSGGGFSRIAVSDGIWNADDHGEGHQCIL